MPRGLPLEALPQGVGVVIMCRGVLDLAAETVKPPGCPRALWVLRSMTRQILALVPDLFFACLEAGGQWLCLSKQAALGIITGFGWTITVARIGPAVRSVM